MQLVTPDLVKDKSARREYSKGVTVKKPANLEEIRRNYEASFVGPKYQAPKQPEPIIEQSSAGDVLPTDMIKLPYEDTSYRANFKRNVVEPVESFLYGVGKASGGGKIERMITGDTPEQLAQREAQAIKEMGNHNKIVNAGATVGSITTPAGLSMVGVPAPLAYGSMAALNKAAETDDKTDIAVAGAKAAFWAKLAGAAGSKYTQGLGKIPITQSNIPANFAKNFVGNFAGAATANYGLGSAEDLYNYARGREVDNAQTFKNAVLNPSNLVYAGIQGYKGTVSDINASKAKLQQDVRNTTENIEAYKRQMTKDTQHSTEAFKQKLAANRQAKINEEIGKLSNNKYLGGKNQLDLEKAVEALRLGNPPPVEIPKAQLALPAQAGQTVQNSVQNVPKTQETSVNAVEKGVSENNLATKAETLPKESPNNGSFSLPKNISIKDSQGREIDHNIHTYSTDAYSGQVNMRKEFQDEDGNTIAKIDYNYYDGEINVDMIETNPEYRRKGLATLLLKDLQNDAKEENMKINYGYTTSDGTKLLQSLDNTTEQVVKDTEAMNLGKNKPTTKMLKKDIENKFKELTGDSIMVAGTKLAGVEIRNNARKSGNLDGELEDNPYSKEAMDLYNQYQNSKKSSNYLYHATGKDRIESIIKKGLTTGNKQNQEGVSSANEIYLSATPELAESFATNDSVTLRINPRFYDKFENFKNDLLGGEGSYSITNNIPPEMLQIQENKKWVNLLNSKLAKQVKEKPVEPPSTPPSPPNNPPTPPTPPSPPNPPEPPEIYDDTEEKIAQLLEERPQKAKMTLQDKVDDLVTSTVNRGHFVDKLAKVSGNKQLKYKYDRMLSSANEGNYVVGEKQTNNEGKIIGKSVNEIWKPVEDAGKVQEFSDYLLHKLNIERMSLENIDELVKAEDEFAKFVKEHQDIAKYAPNTIKQIAEGKKTIADGKLKKVTDEIAVDEGIQELAKQYVELDKQVETMEGRKNKPVFGDTVTADDSKAIVAEYEKNNPEFKEWSNDIKTFNKNQLQNMVDAGLTSKETQELLNSMYDNYVRIHRQVGGDVPVTNRNGRLKVNSPIKTAKGGNQDILPLKDSMAQQAIEVKKAISRNLFGQELLNTLNNGEEVQDYGEVLEEGKNGEAPTFTVFEEGKPITMKINEELYKAIKPAERLAIEDRVITQGLQKAVRFQKAVLTSKNPIFAFTNFVRDLQTATVNSKDTKKMLNNYRKLAVLKFSDIYEKNTGKPLSTKQDNQYLREMWELYKANGGESNTYFDFEKGTNVEPKGKVSKALKIMNDKIFGLNEVIEQMPRVAEFITTLENGGTIDEAMYNAADVTVNFKRGGDFTKFLDRNGVSFLNASIQGLDKQIRNLTDDGIKGAANFIIKCALLGIVPAVANHLLMGDDEDYEDLPNYIKDNYWLVKTGDDTFLRIPRGRDIPTFLGNVAARTVRASQGENKAFDGLVDTFSNTLAPNNPLTDNIFAPINAVRTNKSWNNSDIVSTSLQNKIPEQQYDAKTTEFAKWIGKNLKVSPKKVDYLLDQYTGGLGDILMPLNTKYAEERGPLSAKFVTDSVKNNKNVSLFYDMKNDLEKKKSSNVATDSEIYQLKYLNDTNKKVSELYKQMREIEASNSKDKEKKEKATEIQKEINALTKDAVEKSEDYGKRAEQHNKNKTKSMN